MAYSAAAPGQNVPTTNLLPADNSEESPLASFEMAVDRLPCTDCGDTICPQPCFHPRWTASAEFIGLSRIGTGRQTLVTTYPVIAPPPASSLIVGQGTERLNSSDLDQGFSSGPQVSLIHHGDCGYDMEFSFFQIDGWTNARTIFPNGASPVMVAPGSSGSFVQTTDHPTQTMGWAYGTNLYNAELNARWDLCSRVTMLAGFRWIDLSENLVGTVSGRTEPFWNTATRNNFFGLQIGELLKIWNCGRFSIDGQMKAGLFDNHAKATSIVSIYRQLCPASASTNHLAFAGEIGLQCKYQATNRLLLKAGYEALWLQGVALAPCQIAKTVSYGAWPPSAESLGVDLQLRRVLPRNHSRPGILVLDELSRFEEVFRPCHSHHGRGFPRNEPPGIVQTHLEADYPSQRATPLT